MAEQGVSLHRSRIYRTKSLPHLGGGGGYGGVGGVGCVGCVLGGLDLDLVADLKAHKMPGEEHDGIPNDSAYRPAMPCGMHVAGPRRTSPARGPGQACAAAACRSTRFLELHIGVWKHAAACCSIPVFEFMCLSACSCSVCTGDILLAPCLPSLLAMLSERSV